MKTWFYKFLTLLSKLFGNWVFVLISRGIATGYFLLFPKRVAVGIDFYRALFPLKNRFYPLLCTFRQYLNFTSVFMDRLLVGAADEITYTSKGWEGFTAELKRGNGAIILMSHMGNWEAAARLLKKKEENLRLLLYMGVRNREEIENLQKESLKKDQIKVIAVDKGEGSPFDLVEGVEFLRSGGVVSMTGDLMWREDQRVTSVDFLNRKAFLPQVPHVFSLMTGAPIFVFFAHKTRSNHYHFTLSPPLHVSASSRDQRKEAIHSSVQAYGDLLEENLKAHPFEWYHFERFLEPKAD